MITLDKKIEIREAVYIYVKYEKMDWLSNIQIGNKHGHKGNILNNEEMKFFNEMVDLLIDHGAIKFKIDTYLLKNPKKTYVKNEKPKSKESKLNIYINRPLDKNSIIDIVTNSTTITDVQKELVSNAKGPISNHIFQDYFTSSNLYFKPYNIGVEYDYIFKKYVYKRKLSPIHIEHIDIKYKEEIKALYEKYPIVLDGKNGEGYWKAHNILLNLNLRGCKSCLIPIEYTPCTNFVKLRSISENIKPFWVMCEMINNRSWKQMLLTPLTGWNNIEQIINRRKPKAVCLKKT